MSAGMMPALDWPGVMRPGQFGPMMRVLLPLLHACAQKVGGVVHRDALGDDDREGDLRVDRLDDRVLGELRRHEDDGDVGAGGLHASATEPKTGTWVPSKSTDWPALRGLTPPTMLVPAASMRRVCLVPSEPVMPWTMTLLSLVRKIAMS